jgi:hypothetical protein
MDSTSMDEVSTVSIELNENNELPQKKISTENLCCSFVEWGWKFTGNCIFFYLNMNRGYSVNKGSGTNGVKGCWLINLSSTFHYNLQQ